ncbi:unnamed protein product, partial [Callosobruchus maculatus]
MDSVVEDFFAEADEIVQSANQRKEELIHKKLMKEKYFETRYATIQRYFLHLSCISKKKFLIELLEKLRSLNSILQILHVITIRSLKITSYSYVDPNSDFVVDNLVWDHDRMLDQEVLEKQIENDVEWFTTLSDDHQVTVIIGLLRLSGGSVKRSVSLPIWRRYYQLKKDIMFLFDSDTTTLTATGELCCNIKRFDRYVEGVMFDPTHPASIEVEKQRKIWQDMIERYKRDVCHSVQKVHGKLEKKERTKKKDMNAEKEETSRRKSMSATIGVQVQQKSEMDVIQLMPIWIVKKIFGFLDAKSLRACKKVNKYWSCVVKELLKEEKARKKLNTQLEAIEKAIGTQKIEEIKNRIRDNITNSRKNKNEVMHYSSGAIAKELVPKTGYLEETSIVEKAVKEPEDVHCSFGSDEECIFLNFWKRKYQGWIHS